ncbi:MAG TPA: S26 family signal peptidase [Methanocella sp.]|uniref:S26 family signal peptidase n=1 Tax=Methanocella sp. TaxID=2052833 RepID=UPI002BAC5F41|nr:S26 family signal peptidase [Methanocella sp.]HTY90486.1 S26 family signal peptidase [Methanocella sp.]
MKDTFHTFMKSDNFWVSLARETLTALLAVGAIALLLFLYAGVWPPMVSVDGLSMYPNMHDGDLIIIQGIQKSPITTYQAALGTNYSTFNGAGDVIVYQPFGLKNMTPVIHRALYYVNASQPMWNGGIAAPSSGYITKGDNNFLFDQSSGICPNTPVRDEWILGVAKFRIPYLGYVRSLFSFIH